MSINLPTLLARKANNEKFSCLTAYDATFAHVISAAGVDVILVGDSLGMVLQGQTSTLPVTMEDMIYHVRCVAQGNQGAMLMADLPFMAYATPVQAMENAAKLMQAGAEIVKIEGGAWLCETISMLSERGIPVCSHLGLTPQSVNKLGGYRVQGKEAQQAEQMVEDAIAHERAGADIILLECVPTSLAKQITESVKVPVIGIGAGVYTDAQVLVMHDLLGISQGHRPKFVKNFMTESDSISGAVEAYVKAVQEGTFPGEEHSFNI
jgi:3-methyl-2-oxobutanoate hydroxymethyltransferase